MGVPLESGKKFYKLTGYFIQLFIDFFIKYFRQIILECAS